MTTYETENRVFISVFGISIYLFIYVSVSVYAKQVSCARLPTITASLCFRSLTKLWCTKMHFTSSVFTALLRFFLLHSHTVSLSLFFLFPSHLPSLSLLICSAVAFTHSGLGATPVTLCKTLHKNTNSASHPFQPQKCLRPQTPTQVCIF